MDAFDSLGVGKSAEQDMQSFSQGTQKKKHDNNIMKLTWGIFVVIVGISAVWWYQNEQNVDTVVAEAAPQVEEFDPASIEPELAEQAELLDQQEAVEASNAVVSELESVASGAEVANQELQLNLK
ncbi:putative membrane protein [Vibrio ishigakensis]|uniref:Putative membrane protein n=1 Tax=Vibrio ishigakensis TaxID=1481914 RepID=A0A0B8PB67_9VIBR|nr:putative membrane protein [Vibrio ishigakensis]